MTYDYQKEKTKYPLPKCSLCSKDAPVLRNNLLYCSDHWIKLFAHIDIPQEKRR